MDRIVIFGAGQIAQLAHFYLTHDSPHEVVGFAVDRSFVREDRFCDLPLVAFEEVRQAFPPESHKMFIAVSYAGLNRLRAERFEEAKAKGYGLISYVSSRATRFPGTRIGDNCFVLEDNTIQPFTRIGANVVLWSGNHIGHHSVIEDHVFFTSHVVLSGHCVVEKSCFLGVTATIRDGVRLGEGSLIGMGACITRDTEAWSVHRGSPARAAGVSSKEVDL